MCNAHDVIEISSRTNRQNIRIPFPKLLSSYISEFNQISLNLTNKILLLFSGKSNKTSVMECYRKLCMLFYCNSLFRFRESFH